MLRERQKARPDPIHAGSSGTVIAVNAAGDANIVVNGIEMSIHAAERASMRYISLADIEGAISNGAKFTYNQGGEVLTGYYNPLTKIFVGVGDRITTVVSLEGKNASNYLRNLLNR